MKHNKRLFALIAAAVMMLAGLPACAHAAASNISEDPLSEPKLTESQIQAATYIHDERFAGAVIADGVDISKWQGKVDWNKVKADGIEYVLLRGGYRGTSEGNLYTDEKFSVNIKNALAAGLDVGIYIYSQAITKAEAIEEAELALKLVKGYDIALPIVIDYEYSGSKGTAGRLYKAGLSKTAQTAICAAFCKKIEDAGYTAMIYANKSMLTSGLNAGELSAKYPIWLANYTQKTTYAGEYSYWQYTPSGVVSGVSGDTDRNFRYILPVERVESISVSPSGTLTWSKVVGAYGYQIWRKAAGETGYSFLTEIKGAGKLAYTDPQSGSYSYIVRAYERSAGKKYCGAYSDVAVRKGEELSAPSLTYRNIDVNTIQIDCEEISGAEGYVLVRRAEGEKTWENVKNAYTKLSYTDTDVTPGTLYYYMARAVNPSYKSSYGKIAVVRARPDIPVIRSAAATDAGIKLTWSAVQDITGYRIMRAEYGSGDFKGIRVTAGTAFTDAAAEKGTAYVYKVQAYKNTGKANVFGYFSDEATAQR